MQVQVLEQQVIAYYYQSDFERMDRALERLQALDKSAKAQWLRCMTRIAILPESRAQARAARRAFRQEWAYLEDSLEKNGDQGLGWQKLRRVSHFYYIYHAINDLEILQGLGRVGARWMQAAINRAARYAKTNKASRMGRAWEPGAPCAWGCWSYQIKQHSIWWLCCRACMHMRLRI